jgi:hypothetical protein
MVKIPFNRHNMNLNLEGNISNSLRKKLRISATPGKIVLNHIVETSFKGLIQVHYTNICLAPERKCHINRLPYEIIKNIFDIVVFTLDCRQLPNGTTVSTINIWHSKKIFIETIMVLIESFPKWRVAILELLHCRRNELPSADPLPYHLKFLSPKQLAIYIEEARVPWNGSRPAAILQIFPTYKILKNMEFFVDPESQVWDSTYRTPPLPVLGDSELGTVSRGSTTVLTILECGHIILRVDGDVGWDHEHEVLCN